MGNIVDLNEFIYDFSYMFMEICQQAEVEELDGSTIHLTEECREFVDGIDDLFALAIKLNINYNQIDVTKDSNNIFLLYLLQAYMNQFSPRTYMVVNEKMYQSYDEQIIDWIVYLNSLMGGD